MRMDNITSVAPYPEPDTRGWRSYVIVILVILALGMAAGAWVMARFGADVRGMADSPQAQAASKALPAESRAENTPMAPTAAQLTAQNAVVVPSSALMSRNTDVLTELAAAKIQAARAESMLIAVAARRALDRGLSLGYIEPLLAQRFGDSQPNAVKTIIAVSRKPVTLENLRMRLETLEPILLGQEKPGGGFWVSLRNEFAQLVVVGDGSKPGQGPQDRMARALRLMDSDRMDAAIIEVEALAGKARAPRWLDDARRYNEARRALDVIETAALVEQPLPID